MAAGLWTADEELLLRAALARPEEAATAWERLRPRFHLDHADHEWYRLIPFVWRNLSEAGIEDPEMPRMKGVFKRTWAETHVLLADLELALSALSSAGIDSMIIKGSGLLASGLVEPGTRLMDDVDVLVGPAATGAAEHALAEAGWVAKPLDLPGDAFAVPLINPSGRQLDLHRRLAPELTLRREPERSDSDAWTRSRRVEVGAASTLVPSATDHLLLVCVHGHRGRGEARLHWVPDAAALLRAGGIDWDLLVGEARRRRVVLVLRSALAALRRLDLPVPRSVVRSLRLTLPTPRDRLVHWARYCPPQRFVVLRLLRYCTVRTSALPLGPAIRATPGHVRRFYGIEAWREVPGRALRRARSASVGKRGPGGLAR